MAELQQGIDVSHCQGEINWQQVSQDPQNIKFVMIKATEGGTYQDPMFRKNWEGTNSNEIISGAYHYFRALSSAPEAQVDNINTTLKGVNFNKNQDFLAIDVEEARNEGATPDQIADNLHSLLIQLKNQNYKQLLIYCNYNYWTNSVNWQKYDFSQYGLWIASWREEPLIPDTWKSTGYTIWQNTDKGNVYGIIGYVDLDYIWHKARQIKKK